MAEKIRFGLIGGGEGAFIGQVHRIAAELDGSARLVAGAFASDPARSIRSGVDLYRLPESRCYGDYRALLDAERQREDGMEFVIIATPNHAHFPIAKAALQAGFHVVCDKPLAMSVAEAEGLSALVRDSQRKFALTHNYTGYPMIREARQLVRSGQLGRIRRVTCEYLQGWLHAPADSKQAQWRTDPARAGVAGCFGDIGSHAENLACYVSGLNIDSVCADLATFVSGRQLDDDGNVLIRFQDGARGVISASQIAVGKENDLSLQIYGETGGIEWRQSDANSLIVRFSDRPYEVRRTGWPGSSQASLAASRIPAGHPEGYLESFAEIYRNFYCDLAGESAEYPGVAEGVRGMRFIERVVESSAHGGVWLSL